MPNKSNLCCGMCIRSLHNCLSPCQRCCKACLFRYLRRDSVTQACLHHPHRACEAVRASVPKLLWTQALCVQVTSGVTRASPTSPPPTPSLGPRLLQAKVQSSRRKIPRGGLGEPNWEELWALLLSLGTHPSPFSHCLAGDM